MTKRYKGTVLFVVDDMKINMVTVNYLLEKNYAVVEFAGFEEALREMEAFREIRNGFQYDIAFVDLVPKIEHYDASSDLPEFRISGKDLLNEMRDKDPTKPLISISECLEFKPTNATMMMKRAVISNPMDEDYQKVYGRKDLDDFIMHLIKRRL